MNIGIMTFHWATNYGAVLQAFALKTYLEKNIPNANVFVIDYYPTKYEKKLKNALRVKSLKALRRNLRDIEKDKKISSFRKRLNLTQRFLSVDALRNSGMQMDILIAGSDQIWNQSYTMLGEGKPTSAYYLDFQPTAKKIAYAASFGCERLAPEVVNYIRPLLTAFDALSVRENTGKAIISSMGLSANLVCDPTLLIGTEDFDTFAESIVCEPYIASYFIRTQTKSTLQFVERLADQLDSSQNLRVIDNCSVEQWVGSIKAASYLITNSYHGVVFACKYHVPFFVLIEEGKLKGMNDRFNTLLNRLGLQQRMITKQCDLKTLKNMEINWSDIDKRLEVIGAESGAFLQQHCSLPEKKSIERLDRVKCTGCGTCINACPTQAISFAFDAEGFEFPMVKPDKCIQCGKCERVCPVLGEQKPAQNVQVYTFQHDDRQVLHRSSSGGAFYAIAASVLEAGGVVYGAAFKQDFSGVKHRMASNLDELSGLLESKYIPSQAYPCFPTIKQQLEAGKRVLFSGTPCQVSGLKRYLGKVYPNMILLAVECHGVPSPTVWRCYQRELESKYSASLAAFHFREKSNGWLGYSIKAEFRNGRVYKINHHEDPYMKCYLKNLSMRDSCFVCPIDLRSCGADVILADAWNEAQAEGPYTVSDGVSRISVCTKIGQEIMEPLKKMRYQQIQTENRSRANLNMPAGRKQFLMDVNKEGASLFKCSKVYIKEPMMLSVKRTLKRALNKL